MIDLLYQVKQKGHKKSPSRIFRERRPCLGEAFLKVPKKNLLEIFSQEGFFATHYAASLQRQENFYVILEGASICLF